MFIHSTIRSACVCCICACGPSTLHDPRRATETEPQREGRLAHWLQPVGSLPLTQNATSMHNLAGGVFVYSTKSVVAVFVLAIHVCVCRDIHVYYVLCVNLYVVLYWHFYVASRAQIAITLSVLPSLTVLLFLAITIVGATILIINKWRKKQSWMWVLLTYSTLCAWYYMQFFTAHIHLMFRSMIICTTY